MDFTWFPLRNSSSANRLFSSRYQPTLGSFSPLKPNPLPPHNKELFSSPSSQNSRAIWLVISPLRSWGDPPVRLAPHVAVQVPLSLFMGSLVKMHLGTGHHKLDRIQKRGLARPVFPGKQDGIIQFNKLVCKPMPVNPAESCTASSSSVFPLSDTAQAYHFHPLNVLYPHCHQNRIINNHTGFFLHRVPIQKLHQIEPLKQAKRIVHGRFINLFFPYF